MYDVCWLTSRCSSAATIDWAQNEVEERREQDRNGERETGKEAGGGRGGAGRGGSIGRRPKDQRSSAKQALLLAERRVDAAEEWSLVKLVGASDSETSARSEARKQVDAEDEASTRSRVEQVMRVRAIKLVKVRVVCECRVWTGEIRKDGNW